MGKKIPILLLIFLGTLLSFGPFITDMYLVALPSMTNYFKVDIKGIQLTLTSALIGLACGQLVFGYIGDIYGRKRPLIIGILFFNLFTFILTMQFAYIASSSFIFQKYYFIKPLSYSILFSTNAAFFGFGSIIPFKKKFTIKSDIVISIILIIITALLTFIPIFNANVYIYEFLLIIFRILTGLCFTIFMSNALNVCRNNAGLGAAFLETFYFLLGGLITPLIGYGNIFYSSGILMVIFSTLNVTSLFLFYSNHKG